MQITENFAPWEFACKTGAPYPLDLIDDEDHAGRTWQLSRLLVLCEVLEVGRAALGRPITIDSGYRTLAYDERLYEASAKDGSVAPASRSQHPKGRAADIVVAGIPPAVVRRTFLKLYDAGQIPRLGGVGLYRGFVHIDVRPQVPAGHIAQWYGNRVSNTASSAT